MKQKPNARGSKIVETTRHAHVWIRRVKVVGARRVASHDILEMIETFTTTTTSSVAHLAVVYGGEVHVGLADAPAIALVRVAVRARPRIEVAGDVNSCCGSRQM